MLEMPSNAFGCFLDTGCVRMSIRICVDTAVVSSGSQNDVWMLLTVYSLFTRKVEGVTILGEGARHKRVKYRNKGIWLCTEVSH